MRALCPIRLVALAVLWLLGVNEAGAQNQSPVPTAGTLATGLLSSAGRAGGMCGFRRATSVAPSGSLG